MQANMELHRLMGKNFTYPKPTATGKQPKTKKANAPTTKTWDGKIPKQPKPIKEKIINRFNFLNF